MNVRCLILALLCVVLSNGCGVAAKKLPSGKMPNLRPYDHFVKIQGINYHYTEYPGEKEPVFLLHGFASSTYSWEKVALELNKEGYHVWALDMKGFGWSDKPKDSQYDTATLMEEVKLFMDKMGLEKTVFVGNALGGFIGVLMSDRYPEKIERMVLISAGGYPMKMPYIINIAKIPFAMATSRLWFGRWMVKRNIIGVMYDPSRVTDEQVDAYYERITTNNGLQAQVKVARALNFDDFEKHMSNVLKNRTRTLIIWGENDSWIPLDKGFLYRKDLKNAVMFLIPECGHIPQEEEPEVTALVILDFIEGRPIRDTRSKG